LFNYLTGYGELPQWRKLIVAPSRMQAFMDREDRSGDRFIRKPARKGRIIASEWTAGNRPWCRRCTEPVKQA